MSGCESEGGSVIPARMEAKWRPNEGRVEVELGLAHPTRSPQQHMYMYQLSLSRAFIRSTFHFTVPNRRATLLISRLSC